ncbi:MAG TPA: hypothetical protein VME18_02480 [Acidobacteriaceae bacterium]|nr:hypothetical protein [Acidobacteriaceae bacterium]
MKSKWIIPLLLSCVYALLAQTAGVPQRQSGNAPAWLQYLGNGRDGALLNANGPMTGDYSLSAFTVPAGSQVTVLGTLIVRSSVCTIDGTISAAGLNGSTVPSAGPSGTTGQNGVGGGSGGGGGGGSSAGFAGGNSAQNLTGRAFMPGGSGGAASGGPGTAGEPAFDSNGWPSMPMGPGDLQMNPAATFFRLFIADGWGQDGFGIGGAEGGWGAQSSGPGGAPGEGGGTIILVCGSIAGSGAILANGGAGGNSTANGQGGGGGGGGGAIILSAQQTLTFNGTTNVAGGAGGVCGSYTDCGAGGAGGDGWTYAIAGWGQ